MSLLHLAAVVVVGIVIVVLGLVYWHESRRPEIRPRTDAAERSGPSAAEADREGPGPRVPGP